MSANKRIAFFVAGVQKGGTTSLDAYLREHPDLSPPSRKELHYFDNEEIDWSSPDDAPLQAAFDHNDGERLRYDATPIYSFWPPCPARLHRYNEGAKLILLLRDPTERAYSHWCMETSRDEETLDFSSAIREERRRIDDLDPLARERRVFSYVARGRYTSQMRALLRFFPCDQLLILKSEDLGADRLKSLDAVARFLGIAPFKDHGAKRENVRVSAFRGLRPSVEDGTFIARELESELVDLATSTGLDVSDWPTMWML